MTALVWVLVILGALVADLLLAIAIAKAMSLRDAHVERVGVGIDVSADGRHAYVATATPTPTGPHLEVVRIDIDRYPAGPQIEGTPLAQQEFAGHVGNDLGRGDRVRAAAAAERRRAETLAEMEAEHESLSARPKFATGGVVPKSSAVVIGEDTPLPFVVQPWQRVLLRWTLEPGRVVAAEALIDRVIPDPTIPKGER